MLVTCIGKDKLIHACKPWEDTCACGAKKDKRYKTIDFTKHYWCYQCDYSLEQESEHDKCD